MDIIFQLIVTQGIISKKFARSNRFTHYNVTNVSASNLGFQHDHQIEFHVKRLFICSFSVFIAYVAMDELHQHDLPDRLCHLLRSWARYVFHRFQTVFYINSTTHFLFVLTVIARF